MPTVCLHNSRLVLRVRNTLFCPCCTPSHRTFSASKRFVQPPQFHQPPRQSTFPPLATSSCLTSTAHGLHLSRRTNSVILLQACIPLRALGSTVQLGKLSLLPSPHHRRFLRGLRGLAPPGRPSPTLGGGALIPDPQKSAKISHSVAQLPAHLWLRSPRP